MSRFLRFWLPLILYCLFIFVMSSTNPDLDLSQIPQEDKFLHAGAYGLLGILVCRAFRSRWVRASGWVLANASLMSASFYGLTDELHQLFVPGRSADPWDWLADTLGAMLGVIVYQGWLFYQSHRVCSRRH